MAYFYRRKHLSTSGRVKTRIRVGSLCSRKANHQRATLCSILTTIPRRNISQMAHKRRRLRPICPNLLISGSQPGEFETAQTHAWRNTIPTRLADAGSSSTHGCHSLIGGVAMPLSVPPFEHRRPRETQVRCFGSDSGGASNSEEWQWHPFVRRCSRAVAMAPHHILCCL